MMLPIPDVLTGEELARVRDLVEAGPWQGGNVTSGRQSALAKRNRQLPEDSEAAREAGKRGLDGLGRSEEATSEIQAPVPISYGVFCL